MKVQIMKLKCKQCGWTWTPRHEDVRKCPRCQSVYWDEEKKKGKKDDTDTISK